MENLIINLIDATISYEERTLMRNVDFTLANAEFSYLIGRTGSGKSSLLKLLYGRYQLSEGHGTIFDFDLKKIDENQIPQLRRKIGMVFQNLSLFENWTVYKNLEFVLKATDWKDELSIETRIKEVLMEVKLFDKVDEIVLRLSGGEQQRLAISRALLNKPKLILADEPTGNIDPQSADDIMYLFHRIAKDNGTAVLFATHDYRLLEKFPARVYECINGKIEEQLI